MMTWFYKFIQSFYAGKYKWHRVFGKPIELYRCENDRRLLSDAMLSEGLCAGHRLRQPAAPTVFELLLVILRVIK